MGGELGLCGGSLRTILRPLPAYMLLLIRVQLPWRLDAAVDLGVGGGHDEAVLVGDGVGGVEDEGGGGVDGLVIIHLWMPLAQPVYIRRKISEIRRRLLLHTQASVPADRHVFLKLLVIALVIG